MAHETPPDLVRPAPRNLSARVAPISDLSGLGQIGLPFYCDDEELLLSLYKQRIYKQSFYNGTELVFAPEQVAEKIAALERTKTILVRRSILEESEPFENGDEDPRFIGRLFLFPFPLARKNAPYVPDEEVRKFVKSKFKRIYIYNDIYYVMVTEQARLRSE